MIIILLEIQNEMIKNANRYVNDSHDLTTKSTFLKELGSYEQDKFC